MTGADDNETCGFFRVSLRGILSDEELALLRASSELGCALSVIDTCGVPVVGKDVPPQVLRAVQSPTPQLRTHAGHDFLGSVFFHDGQELAFLLCELPSEPATRARAIRSAHYLVRMTETLLCSAVRRTLMTRLHHLQVEETHLEVAQKDQRLKQAVARMKDTEAIKTSFLATVSHELRTPLTSVIGYTEMMLEGLAGPVSDQQREYLETILGKSDQLHQLISKLLDVSRLEVSSVQLQPAPVEVKALLAEVLRSLSAQIRRKRTRTRLTAADDLPHLFADRDKLRQVFHNLISNAVKFTRDEGEVSVTVEQKVPDRLLFQVSDNGIGIPAHLHDKVFDAFFQVDNTSTREHEGSGLGLLLVRRYIAAHGGKVWIENRPQGGTSFQIELPVHSRPATVDTARRNGSG